MNRKALLLVICTFITGLTLLAIRSNNQIEQKPHAERPLVIVALAYNNSEWVNKNLTSIFSQIYNNYRVIYIDDCSTDNTYELVKEFIEENNLHSKITLIKNTQRKGAMANHFTAAHMCQDNEIIVHLDSDDWFSHENVLQKVNQTYSDPQVWMTYGQYKIYPGGKIGICREFPSIVHEKNIYREYEWISSALRTFYAWLFKRIALKDCLYKGKWFPVNCDRVIMYSLLVMARERCKFIPDILYIYNCARPENDYKQHLILQWHCNHVICSRKKYNRILKKPDFTKKDPLPKTSMLIFSNDNPLLTQSTLESAMLNISYLDKIILLYPSQNYALTTVYDQLKKKYQNVEFYQYSTNVNSNLPSIMENILKKTDYVLFAHDGIIIKNPININEAVKAMEKTKAYGFYFTLGKNITENINVKHKQKLPPFISIDNTISAWQFECGEYDWKKPHSLSLTLYNAHIISQTISSLAFDSPTLFEKLWPHTLFDMNNVGLIYNESPAIILNETIIPETGCTLFLQGFKLDITTATTIKNKSTHVCHEIPLIT